jgi:cytochrome c-type biogenesis protein
VLAAFVLGLVFGVALGPCTFAYMAPMLGVTFRLASSNPSMELCCWRRTVRAIAA